MSTAHIPSLNSRTRNAATNTRLALKRDPLSKQPVFRPSPRNWNNGATRCSNIGGNVFLIVFKTREALPLTFVRFWRPRTGRDKSAEHPRNVIVPSPELRPVRDRGSSEHAVWTKTVHVCEQSATAFCPGASSRLGTVRACGRSSAATVHEQASATRAISPQLVRSRGISSPQDLPQTLTVRDLQRVREHPRHYVTLSEFNSFRFHVRVSIHPSHVRV